MNKRIYLILLPVLALILSVINCKEDSSAFFNKTVSGFSISATREGNNRGTAIFGKDGSHKHKNAIRIKAWDDASAMIAPPAWIPFTNPGYNTRSFYSYYTSPVLSLRVTRHKLRGPPVV